MFFLAFEIYVGCTPAAIADALDRFSIVVANERGLPA